MEGTWQGYARVRFLAFQIDYQKFPKFLIDKCIKTFLDQKYRSPIELKSDPEDSLNFVFPYFGSQSEKLKNELERILVKYFPNFNFRIILVNKFTIGSFFGYKDRLPKTVQSSLVYEYSCAQCASRYVGSTHRNMYMRVAEHAGFSFRTQAPLTSPPFSAIREHSEQCNTSISSDDFKILDKNKFYTDLRILESLYISKRKPQLNNSVSAFPLHIVGS